MDFGLKMNIMWVPSGAVSGGSSGSSGSQEPLDFLSLVINQPNLPVIFVKFEVKEPLDLKSYRHQCTLIAREMSKNNNWADL